MQRADDRITLKVVGQWNGWRTANIHVADLEDVHWFRPSGAPKALLHGYLLCSKIIDGEIPHDCVRTTQPHRVLVCILKSHTVSGLYGELAVRANASRQERAQAVIPPPPLPAGRPHGRRGLIWPFSRAPRSA